MPRRAWSRRGAVLLVLGVLGSVSARTARRPEEPATTVTIVIDGAVFTPATATAHVGDTVAWTNKDVVDHTATADHNAWRVVVKAGKTATMVVKTAGTFEYACEFHPNMTGELTVKPPAA